MPQPQTVLLILIRNLSDRCLGHVEVRKSSSDSTQDFYYLSVESFQDRKNCGHQLVLVASCWK